MQFAALDSAFGRSVIERHPEIRGFDSVLYVEPATDRKPERVYTHSSAVIRVGSYLGGTWHLLQFTRILPAFVRDAVYRLVARHRHRLSGSRTQCVIPSAQDRARFLE
jgi:predicted DCC family thiol-disulfide oxidoreductase YuxK